MSGEQLQNVLHDFWLWRIKDAPEFATQIGIRDYDDKLDSYDLTAFHRRKEVCVQFINRAMALQDFVKLDDDIFNLALFLEELNTYITGYNYKGYLWPINYMEGVQVDFERLVQWMVFEEKEDYERLLSRYSALPTQIAEIIKLLQEGIDLGMTCHYVTMDGVIEQFDRIQVAAEESAIFSPFRKFPHNLSEVVKADLFARGRDSFENIVRPAFAKLRQFLAEEYMNHLRTDISCMSLPNGAVLYQQCLNFHLTIELNARQVHETGLQEVARIEKEMQTIITNLGRATTVKDFWANLRNTRDFYFHNKQDLFQAFSDLVTTKIRPLIPKVIKNIPRSQLVVKPFPNSISAGPACYYLAGSADGVRPGTFFINLAQYANQPKYEMMSLCLHEAEPGHHTQASTAMERAKPSFRRFLEDRKYSDAPSRFPIYTSFVEGWGLYCETLGEELGLYNDPYAKFGHCSQEIFRACRLVVDTGIHALGWSQETAVSFMKDHSAASEANIVNEIRRYITWPGQACAYKIGEMKIRDLRKSAEKALGLDFDVKDFHDLILNHAGPLALLEKQVEKYIRNVKIAVSQQSE